MLTYHDAAGATLIRVLAALPGYVILITAWRRWPAMLAALRDPPAMTALTIGSVVGPFAGAVLMMVALEHSTAGVVTTITATMPVLILPLSILVYHERIGLRAVGGARAGRGRRRPADALTEAGNVGFGTILGDVLVGIAPCAAHLPGVV